MRRAVVPNKSRIAYGRDLNDNSLVARLRYLLRERYQSTNHAYEAAPGYTPFQNEQKNARRVPWVRQHRLPGGQTPRFDTACSSVGDLKITLQPRARLDLSTARRNEASPPAVAATELYGACHELSE